MPTLDELAAKANAAHEAGLAKHIECGETLREAQHRCQTKGIAWLEWVEGNLSFGYKQAAKYMRLSRNVPPRGHSTINEALKSIATPRTPSGEAEPSAPQDEPAPKPASVRPNAKITTKMKAASAKVSRAPWMDVRDAFDKLDDDNKLAMYGYVATWQHKWSKSNDQTGKTTPTARSVKEGEARKAEECGDRSVVDLSERRAALNGTTTQ